MQVKSVDVAQRIIEGYASVSGNEDGVADIVDAGAWKSSIADHEKTSFKALDAYIGHKHRFGDLPVGMPVEVREDGQGLYTKTRIHKSTAGDDLLAVASERLEAGKPL